MWELQKPHIEILCWIDEFLKIEKRPTRHMSSLPQEVVMREYGLVVFIESTIINDDVHGEKSSQVLTRMRATLYFSATICGLKLQGSRQTQGLL